MKKFILKIFIFIVIISSLLSLIYGIGIYLSQHTQTKEVVYVWGDSQMYQGLDLESLSSQIGIPVLSSAEHGNGIYDFLVTIDCIQPQSTCIIALPECALYRNPLSDSNRTGLNINALLTLHNSGCPIKECLKMVSLNRNNFYYQPFSSINTLYEYAPEIEYAEPLEGFCNMFNETSDYSLWKKRAYLAGLQKLADKDCRIILVQFPFDKQVEACAERSVNRLKTDSLVVYLCEQYDFSASNISLQNDSILMHDLSHLNCIGARLVTDRVATILNETNNNILISFTLQ